MTVSWYYNYVLSFSSDKKTKFQENPPQTDLDDCHFVLSLLFARMHINPLPAGVAYIRVFIFY